MAFVKNLEVMISFDKNDSVLYTQRLRAQPLSVFLSNLAGSVIGLLGTIGFFMNQFEGNYEIYVKSRKHNLTLDQIKKHRIEIIDQNLFMYETSDPKLESPQVSSRVLITSEDLSITTNNIPYCSKYHNTK